MAKLLGPEHIPDLSTSPVDAAEPGFVKVYIKNGWYYKLASDSVESDLILDRPLLNLSLSNDAQRITVNNTVLTAFEQLQKSLDVLQLKGDVTGIAVYENGEYVIHTTVIGGINISEDVSDYDYDILGVKDGVNTVFELTQPFIASTTKVYLNGVRQTPGVGYDYTESNTQEITFSTALVSDDMITVDYKIQTII